MKLTTLALGLFASSVFSLLEEQIVAFNHSDDAIPIHQAHIVYASDDDSAVSIAAASLVSDLEAITDVRPQLQAIESLNDLDAAHNASSGSLIIAGTADSAIIQDLSAQGHLDLSGLEGKWEKFKTAVLQDALPGNRSALAIVGSDARGVVFGIYTLAEQCGQSPFHWWLDTPTKKHNEIYVLPKTTVHGEPSVKYRGLFINDEAPATMEWWAKTHNVDHKKLGREYYSHVFDLLLRLKANFIWPAMWESFVPPPGRIFFTDDPYNQIMAEQYGITVSTSHHEPMQRATNEWNETETGPWSWNVNKENVTEFMRYGVERALGNDTYYTLGMRGPSDSSIEGDDPIGILRDVLQTQRDIFEEYYGNATDVKKVWTLYKEVQTYYSQGLIPEDDVTLMFSDDNWGNIQRLPLSNETSRSGGIGLYFHTEYVGVPMSYQWTDTNNLPKIYKDLYHAHERGVDQIMVINVADIKPMELPFGFIMDYIWNPSTITPDSIPRYLEAYAAREFGGHMAKEIAAVMQEYSRLVGNRRFESVTPATYSTLNYHEADRVLGEWQRLAGETSRIGKALPSEYAATFYHLAEYKARAGYNYHRVLIGQGRNQQYALERRNTANQVAQDVLEYFDSDVDLTEKYDQIAGGKWKGIMSTPHFAPIDGWKQTSRNTLSNLSYVQLREDPVPEYGPLGIYAEGCGSAMAMGYFTGSIDPSAPTEDVWAPVLPQLDRYGPANRTVEMFHRGDYRVPVNWTIENDYDWLKLSQTSGQVSRDVSQQEVQVLVDWDSVPADFNDTLELRVTWNAQPYFDLLRVPVSNMQAPEDFHGFPESDGLVSIEAPHYQRHSDGNVSFEQFQYLGTRSTSGSLALRPYRAARMDSFSPMSTWVEYDIFTFEDSPGLNATVYFNMALDTDPLLPMKYAMSLDSSNATLTRLVDAPEVAGDLPETWLDEVANGVWTRNATFGPVAKGRHTLRFMTDSPEVYLEKIVLAVSGDVRPSYLGPPETLMV